MMCVFLCFWRYDVCFLFVKSNVLFLRGRDWGNRVSKCCGLQRQPSISSAHLKKFFLEFFFRDMIQILTQVCYLPTNTCKDQLIMELSQMSSCTKVMVVVMLMLMLMLVAVNFFFLTLASITLNYFQSSDCNDNEICYLDTKVNMFIRFETRIYLLFIVTATGCYQSVWKEILSDRHLHFSET